MSKSVAIIVSSFLGGGAEKSMSILHTELSSRGVNSTLCSINESDLPEPFNSSKVVAIRRNKESGLLNFIFSYLKFCLFVITRRPDILLLNCDLPELFGAFVPVSNKRVKFVVVEHANSSWPTRRKLGRLVRAILNRRGAYFISVSSHINSPFGTHGYHKVIPNLLGDLSQFLEHHSTNRVDRLVYVGRLTSVYKSPQSMIFISKDTGIPVTFYGTGELETELEAMALQEHVDVTFQGWVEDPWSQIGSGDLLIVPSTREGDGLVVVEGISRGIPILLRDVPDLRRFGLEEFHYCLEDADFSEKIKDFKENLCNLKPSSEVKTKLIEERNASRLTENWITFFNEI